MFVAAAEEVAAEFSHLHGDGAEDLHPARVGKPFLESGLPVEDAGEVKGGLEGDGERMADIGGGGSDEDIESAVFGDPTVVPGVEEGEGAEIEGDGNGFCLTGLELDFWPSLLCRVSCHEDFGSCRQLRVVGDLSDANHLGPRRADGNAADRSGHGLRVCIPLRNHGPWSL